MSIEVLDADNVGRLPSTAGSPDPASCYIASVVRRGPRSYVDNANVRMEALVIDGKVLPLVISKRVEGNSNVCSVYAHYFEYAFQELAKRYRRVPLGLLNAPRSLLGALLRSGSIDSVVFVNNWLLTTNPSHGLWSAQIAALTAYLTGRYPGSAIVFRSVNPLADLRGHDALQTNGYHLVPSRRIYMLDARNQLYLERRNVREDLRRLRQTSYSIVDRPEDLVPHAPRIAALYRDLYCGKYSQLNPQYNTNFVSLTLGERFLTYRALIEDGRVDAFMAYFIKDGLITASLIAHDLQRPRNLGLYRLAFALMIAEAAQRKALLNLSAGVGDFKMLRGAVPVQEFDAVYDRHLPISRRLPWVGIRMAAGLGRLSFRAAKVFVSKT
jgi:hypothetical protein